MTTQITNAPARPFLDLRALLRSIGVFFINMTNAAQMSHEIERLMAMSDGELARRGLRREDIVRHVFGMSVID
jgi:hypothetical protein